MEQNRWKSPVVWSSLGALLLAFLLSAGVIGAEMDGLLKNLIEAILVFLSGVGVLNNPQNKTGF